MTALQQAIFDRVFESIPNTLEEIFKAFVAELEEARRDTALEDQLREYERENDRLTKLLAMRSLQALYDEKSRAQVTKETSTVDVDNVETKKFEEDNGTAITVVQSKRLPSYVKRVAPEPLPWPYSFDVEFAINLFGSAVRNKQTLILETLSGQAKIDGFKFLDDKKEDIKTIQENPNALHAAMIQNLKNEWSKL